MLQSNKWPKVWVKSISAAHNSSRELIGGWRRDSPFGTSARASLSRCCESEWLDRTSVVVCERKGEAFACVRERLWGSEWESREREREGNALKGGFESLTSEIMFWATSVSGESSSREADYVQFWKLKRSQINVCNRKQKLTFAVIVKTVCEYKPLVVATSRWGAKTRRKLAVLLNETGAVPQELH